MTPSTINPVFAFLNIITRAPLTERLKSVWLTIWAKSARAGSRIRGSIAAASAEPDTKNKTGWTGGQREAEDVSVGEFWFAAYRPSQVACSVALPGTPRKETTDTDTDHRTRLQDTRNAQIVERARREVIAYDGLCSTTPTV